MRMLLVTFRDGQHSFLHFFLVSGFDNFRRLGAAEIHVVQLFKMRL